MAKIIKWLASCRPDRVFMILGGLSMMASLFLVPPFMTPDETTHFKRAYSVSLGTIWPEYDNGIPGFWAPASAQTAIDRYFDPELEPLSLAYTWQELHRPLEPEIQKFIQFRPEAIYSPLGYLPQVIGIAIGRSLNATPIAMLFLARLVNLALTMGLILWAIRIMPVGKAALLLVALLPMTQHLLASASPDSITIAGGMLFCAALLRAYLDDDWRASRVLLILIAGTLMCSTRSAYAPLLAAGSGVVFLGFFQSWRWLVAIAQGVASIAVFYGSALWLNSVGALANSSRAGTDPQAHMELLKSDPVSTVAYLLNSLVHTAPQLIQGMLGHLSWSNLTLYTWQYLLLIALFPISMIAVSQTSSTVRRHLNLLSTLWVLFLIALVVMVIELGLFLIWTPVGAPFVEGVLGRYYLPFLPLLLIIPIVTLRFDRIPISSANFAYAFLIAALGFSCLATSVRIVGFFGLV